MRHAPDISLHPIDVGFDIRLHEDMDVAITPDMRSADIDWPWDAALRAVGPETLVKDGRQLPSMIQTSDGHVRIYAETVDDLIYFLRKAGYRAVLSEGK